MAAERTSCVARARTAPEVLRHQGVQTTTGKVARVPFRISSARYTDQHRSVGTWIGPRTRANRAAVGAATNEVEGVISRPIIVGGSSAAPLRIPLRCRTNMPPGGANTGAAGKKAFACTAVHGRCEYLFSRARRASRPWAWQHYIPTASWTGYGGRVTTKDVFRDGITGSRVTDPYPCGVDRGVVKYTIAGNGVVAARGVDPNTHPTSRHQVDVIGKQLDGCSVQNHRLMGGIERVSAHCASGSDYAQRHGGTDLIARDVYCHSRGGIDL
jgi:hypothetical protein